MTTIGKDFPVRSDAFRFSSEKRASSAATSPARTECFDIFSAEPGDSDVTSQMERLSSKEMKIAARLDWMAVGASCRSAHMGSFGSRGEIHSCKVKLRRQFRYPRSEPVCMTRLVSEHDQPHIRSPLETAAPRSRLRRAGAQGGRNHSVDRLFQAMAAIGSSTRIRQN